ncbi:hypothetical protein [Shivajiella indica]|uniref:Porin family protein n=1 Tax=Shivajiella indica TaxID=872115 RepID=A0ABW5BB43_9BACT
MLYINVKKFLSTIVIALLIIQVNQAQNFYKERNPRNTFLSFGVGPSIIYAETGGQYNKLDFDFKPALSFSYAKKINPLINLQATAGLQWIGSGGNPPEEAYNQWIASESALSFSGRAYYLDVMPVMNIIPFSHHMQRNYLNFYGGLGIGVMQINTKRYYTLEENSREYIANFPTAYIPVRAGMSYRIGDYYDLSLEGGMLLTFSDDIDGNQNWNAFNDHLLQIQVVLKKYLATKSPKF